MRHKRERNKIVKRMAAFFLAGVMTLQTPMPYLQIAAEDQAEVTESVIREAEEQVQETTAPQTTEAVQETTAPQTTETVQETTAPQTTETVQEITGETEGTEDNSIESEVITTPATESESNTGSESESGQEQTGVSTEEAESDTESESVSESEKESETETEVHHAEDITNEMGQLKLNLGSAWYLAANGEKRALEEQEGRADYSVIPAEELQNTDGTVTAGLSVLYRLYENGDARTIKQGDWFTVQFPETITNIRVAEDGLVCRGGEMDESFEGIRCKVNQEEHSLKVTFLDTIDSEEMVNIYGNVQLEFEIRADLLGDTVSESVLQLQKKGDKENLFAMVMPAKKDAEETNTEMITEALTEVDAESTVMLLDVADLPEENSSGLIQGEFTVSGDITFNETLGDINWSGLVRPAEFEHKIWIRQTYTDGNGEQITNEYQAQEDLSKDPFYLKFIHDGNGGGEFKIEHVPKTVTTNEGQEYQVSKYEIYVVPNQPYYPSNVITTELENFKNANDITGTLNLSLQSQTLTLNPTVYPETAGGSDTFQMDVVFRNTMIEKDPLKKSYRVGAGNNSVVKVPVGIQYQVTQVPAAGYKFSGDYTIISKTEGEEPIEKTEATAVGTMEEGVDVTVSTVNYAQNVVVGFTVEWIDNNKVTRPELSGNHFELQYKGADGLWKTITKEDLPLLGIETMPGFEKSATVPGGYHFTGLPAADQNGNALSYQVKVKSPDGYVAVPDTVIDGETVTFEEVITYQADIFWNDESDIEMTKRPDTITDLHFYRKLTDGNYEPVTNLDLNEYIKKSGNQWTVTMENLPRYGYDSISNKYLEYDYVLVQGTIVKDTEGNAVIVPITWNDYRTYYNNGSGNYGTDRSLCHNHGQITEVLYANADFSVTKEWHDQETTAENRPEAKLTLWRYVKSINEDNTEDPADLDAAFSDGKAAQVVFQNGTQEEIISFTLDKNQNTQTIQVSAVSGEGSSKTYELPRYDDKGREYVYFVREMLSGEKQKSYDIQYRDQDGKVYQNGTVNNGTIMNVRREKAAVAIHKIWQNPANLASLDGVSVQLKIEAPLVGGNDYKELTVYSSDPNSFAVLTGEEKDKKQTATGFSSGTASAEVVYYVNIYDENGQPFDMEKAHITEIIKKGTENETVITNGSFQLGNDQYMVSTTYDGQNTIDGVTKQFHYTQKNTVTGTTNYTITKKWDQSIPESEYSNIQVINFSLERRTTKINPDGSAAKFESIDGTWQITRDEETSTSGDPVFWSHKITDLPRYDSEGYEYEYRATEVSFVTANSTFTTTDAYSSKEWSVEHYRTSKQTTAVNYKRSTSTSETYFRVSKNWVDNGDTDARKDVNIRVFYREDLLSQLTAQKGAQSEDAYVNLAKLKNYREYTITDDNYSTKNIKCSDFNDIANALNKDVNYKNNWKNYIVIEYTVGTETDRAKPAEYTYGQLMAAAQNEQYSFSGKAENNKRLYEIHTAVDGSNNYGHIYITNTRTGTTNLTVNKTWQDDNNIAGKRPASLDFQIYQDGRPYIPESVMINGTGATLNHETGIVTVNNNGGNTWSFEVNGLPMFSALALPHTYDVEEVPIVLNYDNIHYVQEKGNTEVSGSEGDPEKNKVQNYTFSFTNTITGTISHNAYKYWRDPSSYAGYRPDLYLTLYRYKMDDKNGNSETDVSKLKTYERYTDHNDPVWTSGTDSSDQEKENGYNWKISIDDLPMFDENGDEYGYVFVEQMNNKGETVLGTYVGTQTTKGTGADSYEVFTNVIKDYVTVNGLKTWSGLSGYNLPADQLPDPDIKLYRTIDSSVTDIQNCTDQQIDEWILSRKIEFVESGKLTENKTVYEFPNKASTERAGVIEKVNGKLMLPKFDPNGQHYTYLIRETISDKIASQLYNETNQNGTLSNVFRNDLNRRKITVTKSWAGRENLKVHEAKYPSVTYTLWRYEKDKEQSTEKEIETYTISSTAFANSKDGTVSYTFDDLLVFSPTGAQYCYYIEEKKIDGYSIHYTDEAGITDAGLAGNDRCDVISVPDGWDTADEINNENLNATVATCNTYDQKGNITISGEKCWNDNNNAEGLRPTSITVHLKRYTNNENGQRNKVEAKEEITLGTKENNNEPYIEWDYSEPDTWKYTIYNLERYAPNGMPYIYTFSEDPVRGYQVADSVTKQANSAQISMDPMTNCFKGTYYVRKNWMDGSNKYNLRPENITVCLERSTGVVNEDQTITWNNDWTEYQTIDLSAGNVINNTRGNSWQYTFKNLPTEIKVTGGENQEEEWRVCRYRCVEKQIGGVELQEKEGKLTAGAYECKHLTQNDEKTIIENTLNSTSLVVTKKWDDEQGDPQDYRPDSLSFVLQKRGIVVRDEGSTGDITSQTSGEGEIALTDWHDVMLADDKPYTFTLSANGQWTKKLTDLPVAEVYKDENGNTGVLYSLYFRAVEKCLDNENSTGRVPVGAPNYIDVTDYRTESTDHYFDNDNTKQNYSNIHNRMVYGYVNLSKTAAYLAPGITENGKLEGVSFDIEKKNDEGEFEPYVTGVITDASGNLINNAGKYGTEQKYLVPGTYLLKESETKPDFGIWSQGVIFVIGRGEKDKNGALIDTGEHGTAWIKTTKTDDQKIGLMVEYKERSDQNHTFGDSCQAYRDESTAVNLESRGVASFTKKGETVSTTLDTHGNAAQESSAYFGVYLEEACVTQVAGMIPLSADKTKMILTNLALNLNTVLDVSDAHSIPYLRPYGDADYPFTLLSGTYYIKELRAPAGYKLDPVVREMVIDPIQTPVDEVVTNLYSDNKAKIKPVSDATGDGTCDYKWCNTPNKLTLYKKDQFGRNVTLNTNGYLELEINDEGKTFPSGTKTIKLYQNASKPSDHTGYVSYDETAKSWTIEGLFDINTLYSLSEETNSVPENNILAKPISFTVGADGKMISAVSNVGIEEKGDPLLVAGDDYQNYYKPDADENIVVMRDVSRYLKDVALHKIRSDDKSGISNIAFELYKKNTQTDTFESVLVPGTYLTTDENGKIVLSELTDDVINQITGKPLKYGLDVGVYYFKEIEFGASDRYRLVGDVYFTITPKDGTQTTDYSDFAQVTFNPSGYPENNHVSTSASDSKMAEVTNDPVTASDFRKTLLLTKAAEDGTTTLCDARFTLEYVSSTNTEAGSANTTTEYCMTDANGELYVATVTEDTWTITLNKPDISKKGTYVLKEIQAPEKYMTRTEDGTENVVSMVTFEVNSENRIVNVISYNGTLVISTNIAKKTGTDEDESLDITLKNEKTVVKVAKKNDIVSNFKTGNQKTLDGEALEGATLKIYEGTVVTETSTAVAASNGESAWNIPSGTLKENTVYTLHESEVPVGYLRADDIYFKLFGTTTIGGQVVSQLYVWNKSGKPDGINGDGWTKSNQDTNLSSQNVLTMVDEAVIAPVDLQKVLQQKDRTYRVLPGAVFQVVSKDDNKILGTAVTNSKGQLVWNTIEDTAYDLGLIYNSANKRITDSEEDQVSVLGQRIILRKNQSGYTFTETVAPQEAYNNGQSFTVTITDEHYLSYKQAQNKSDVYVNIKNGTFTTSTGEDESPTATDVINPYFEASFELYKYDAEHPLLQSMHYYQTIGLAGVKFTLYYQTEEGRWELEGAENGYVTGEKGLLHIDLYKKGTYKLIETTPLAGYDNTNPKEMIFRVDNEDYQKTLTYSEEEPKHAVVIQNLNGTEAENVSAYELPNRRLHGTVTLTKKDAQSNVLLNGVQYQLIRTSPSERNSLVDKWFPPDGNTELLVETGKKYSKVATAETKDEFDQNTFGNTDGVLTIEDLQWGTYKLVEIQEKNGYILETKEFRFEISATQLNPTVQDEGKDYVGNTKNKLTIKKTDINDQELSGAQFQLYPVVVTGETQTMGNASVHFYRTADATQIDESSTVITAGETAIYGLTKGTYVLREVKAPDGYERAKDAIFTLQADGTIIDVTTCTVREDGVITKDNNVETVGANKAVITLDTSGSASTTENMLTVRNRAIEVSLTKVLKDGDKTVDVSGRGSATFVIKGVFADSNGAEEEKTFTSNAITTDLYAKLIGGNSYTIRETASPAGFEVEKETATISVGTDGEIAISGTPSFLTVDNTDGIASMTFTDQPIQLGLRKVDAKGADIPQQTLGYATFKVEGEFVKTDGSGTETTSIENLTTDDFTSTLSRRIIAEQSYTVTEMKAPDGYRLTGTFTFTVDKNGDIQLINQSNENNVSGLSTDVLTVTNRPNEITFIKKDDGGNLADAQFTLTAKDENQTKAFVNITNENMIEEATTWKENEIQWTSTDTGTTLTNHLIAGVSYRLHEVARVPNHELMDNDIVFHVNMDGTIEIDENSGIPNNDGSAAAISGTTMTIRNPLIKGTVVLTKYFTAKKKDNYSINSDYHTTDTLAGAVYELYRTKDENGNTLDPDQIVKTDANNTYNTSGTKTRFETDSDGKITITNLPEGEYYFKEVDAPKAYYIDDNTKIVFSISDNTKAFASVTAVDPRINAKISLTKYSGSDVLKEVTFDVKYSETGEENTFCTIGKIVTDENGSGKLDKARYSGCTEEETLRRGYYRLIELSAEGQMMNTTDGTRNTISFEIGNVCDKEYEVKDHQDINYNLGGDPTYITLSDYGVVDTPIPTKTVSVEKIWKDDDKLIETFRPESVEVELWRSYTDINNVTYRECVGDNKKTLNSSNGWKATWTNLPSYVNIVTDSATNELTTYLYTYEVKEVDPKPWYSVTYGYNTQTGTGAESTVQDGDTKATITNTMTTRELNITKALGGGSSNDEFKVRVKLTDPQNTSPIGNNNNGYYMDSYRVSGTDSSQGTPPNPDTEGWMTIKGGETITILLPENVKYEVEEKTNSSGKAELNGTSGYVYTPRYDAVQIGTITRDTGEEINTTIQNAVQKSIILKKVDSSDNSKSLTGAEFKVVYEPLKNPSFDNAVTKEWKKDGCIVDTGNKLVDKDHKTLDITPQGTYKIYETKAPDNYMTPTDNNGNPIVLATIKVDNKDMMTVEIGTGDNDSQKIDGIDYNVTAKDLVQKEVTTDGSIANITVKNEATKARIGKTIDYAKQNDTNDSLEGTYLSGATMQIFSGDDQIAKWTTVAAPHITQNILLKENTVYTLKEVEAPTGYKKAADQYFIVSGTYTVKEGTNNVRYSRIVMTDSAGKALDNQNTDGMNYGDPGVVDGVLNMVDETIIAPVDLQKVLEDYDNKDQWSKVADVKFKVMAGDTELGTAITNSSGNLIWHEIQDAAYSLNLIYDPVGKLAVKNENGSSSVTGKEIILRQNDTSYTFTEVDAPDHVYNDGRTYHVSVTEQNYDEYRMHDPSDNPVKSSPLYDTQKYINLVEAQKNSSDYTVNTLSSRDQTISQKDQLAVNLPYKATVTLHKYDEDVEAKKAAIENTEFTLYRGSVADNNIFNEAFSGNVMNTSGVFKTDVSGNITIEIRKKGTYILKETKAAPGYKNDARSFTFTLTDKEEGGTYGYDSTNELKSEGDQNGVPNSRYKGEITLTKKDSKVSVPEEYLNDVEYSLTRTDQTVDENGTQPTVTVTTGKNYTVSSDSLWSLTEAPGTPGTIHVEGLNWGTYELKETKENPGYVLDTSSRPHEFEIKADSFKEDGKMKAAISFPDTNTKNHIIFYKTNNTNDTEGQTKKGLQGAVFEVHEGEICSEECTTASFYLSDTVASTELNVKVKQVISGEDGKVSIYGLPTDINSDAPKKYHLKEVKAPKGYKLQTEPVVFSIDRQGKVRLQDNTEAADYTVQMKDDLIKLYIQKLGQTGKEPLGGAEFELTDVCTDTNCDHTLADGTSTSVQIKVENGKVLVPAETVIGGHTYLLKETKAPDGYECTAEVIFEVGEDGTIEKISATGGYGNCAEVTDDQGVPVITVRDKETVIKIKKVGENPNSGGEDIPLAGVKFKIKPYRDMDTFADGTKAEKELTPTDKNGMIFLTKLLVCNNDYVLWESDIGENKSYKLPDDKTKQQVVIHVDQNGKISFKSSNSLYSVNTEESAEGADDAGKVITVRNELINVVIGKVDVDTNALLPGVTLKLTPVTPDLTLADVKVYELTENAQTGMTGATVTESSITWTTTGNRVLFRNLKPGQYQLEETAVPADGGYRRITSSYTFEVKQNGTVSADTTNNAFVITNHDDGEINKESEITVKNELYKTVLEIIKNGSDGKLQNVAFKLEKKNATGEYVAFNTGNSDDKSILITGSDGKCTFTDLTNGTYRLTEIQTVNGYNLLSRAIIIEIDRQDSSNQGTSKEDDKAFWYFEGDNPESGKHTVTLDGNTMSIELVNKQGFALPATGVPEEQLPPYVLALVGFAYAAMLFTSMQNGKKEERRKKKK